MGNVREPELIIGLIPLKPVDGAGLSIRGITLYFELIITLGDYSNPSSGGAQYVKILGLFAAFYARR
jgi:hypothetical protein